jgi:L-fucose mutarotase/ribose pyranase (RbsD/FucU family)
MLWGIDPLLDADLLYALRRMGHGDEIAIVDANFPSIAPLAGACLWSASNATRSTTARARLSPFS